MLRILINSLVISLLSVLPSFAFVGNGSSFSEMTVYRGNGSSFDSVTVYHGNGSSWVDITEGGGGGAGVVSFGAAGSVGTVAAGTALSLTAPTNSSGDLLLAIVSDDTDQAISDFDGFTLITSQSQSSHRLSIGYLVADGSTAYSITLPASTDSSGVIIRLTKDTGTWNVADFESVGATAADPTLPDVTVSNDNSILIVAYGNDDDNATVTGPSGMTEAASYTAADPRLSAWYLAQDTGTVSGVTVGVSEASDSTLIGVVVEAQ